MALALRKGHVKVQVPARPGPAGLRREGMIEKKRGRGAQPYST